MESIELSTIIGSLKQNLIFHIELNRPRQLNAMSHQFFSDLQTIFKKIHELQKTNDIRVIVLTARGKHFTAGLDLKEATEMFQKQEDIDPARKAIKFYDLIKDWQSSMNVLADCSLPVIVGIHGYCIGGGIDFITSADIRYCTQDSQFSIKEVDIGMAADIGTLQRIGAIAGNHSLARELIYTARFFDSKEAKELGLVNKVCINQEEMLKDIFTLADTIASKSPVAIYTSKSVLHKEMKKRIDDNLDSMARINSAMLQTNDIPIAVMASLSKSKGEYPKL